MEGAVFFAFNVEVVLGNPCSASRFSPVSYFVHFDPYFPSHKRVLPVDRLVLLLEPGQFNVSLVFGPVQVPPEVGCLAWAVMWAYRSTPKYYYQKKIIE